MVVVVGEVGSAAGGMVLACFRTLLAACVRARGNGMLVLGGRRAGAFGFTGWVKKIVRVCIRC